MISYALGGRFDDLQILGIKCRRTLLEVSRCVLTLLRRLLVYTNSQPSIVLCQSLRASCHSQLISSLSLYPHTAMSCDKSVAQCGTWITLPAQSDDHLHTTTVSPHSTNTMDVSSDPPRDPTISSADDHTNDDLVVSLASAASTTAVSGDNELGYSVEAQHSDTSTDLSTDQSSVPSDGIDDIPPRIPANVDACHREGPTTHTSTNPPLTTANLMAHEKTTSALPSSNSSVALWLTSGMEEHQTDADDWSRLVASDPLAAAIEAVVVVDSQGQAIQDVEITTG
jgi:hypothetical protein